MALERKIDARSRLQEALEGVRTLGDRLKDAVPGELTTTVKVQLDPASRTTLLGELENLRQEDPPMSQARRKEADWAQERSTPKEGEDPSTQTSKPKEPDSPPQKRRFSHRPSPRAWRRATWDGPEDHPEAEPSRLKELAQQGWTKIREGGALHTLREAGRFGTQWGEFLEGEATREQRAWSNTAARPEGRAVSDAMERVERLGTRIGKWLAEIQGGGEGALRAAEHLRKARVELDEVGAAGRRAAEALGGPRGEALREELARAEKSAGEGLPAPSEPEESGAKVNPRRFLNLLQDPLGAARTALEEGLLSRYGGALSSFLGQGAWRAFSGGGVGGAAGAVGATVAGAAAVAGGAYAGYRLQLGRASDTVRDAGKALEDARLSQSVGIDYRGSLWEADRLRTKDGTPLEAREILRDLGVSLRPSAFRAPRGLLPLTQDLAASADMLGLEAPKVASLAGAAMRSGTVERGEGGVDRILALLASWREEALRSGLTLNERLGVLSQLSAQQVQQTGFLTERSLRTLGEAADHFDRTGHPSLMGEAGGGVLQALTRSDRNDTQKALLAGEFFDGKHLTKLGWERARADLRPEDLKALIAAPEGEWGVTRALLESPASLLSGAQSLARQVKDLPLWLQQGMLGLERNGTVQSLRAVETLRESEDLTGTARLRRALAGESEELGREARGARSVQASGVRSEDARESTMTWETAVNLKDFSTDMKDAVRQFAQAVDDFGGYGRHPMSWKERGAAVLMGTPGGQGLGAWMWADAQVPKPNAPSPARR
ncbi:MAG: hypothetical protein HYZ13_09245 [Acidobacteria bacterium]|nr:hypothetical protein [Acidobacteriota bacterium]